MDCRMIVAGTVSTLYHLLGFDSSPLCAWDHFSVLSINDRLRGEQWCACSARYSMSQHITQSYASTSQCRVPSGEKIIDEVKSSVRLYRKIFIRTYLYLYPMSADRLIDRWLPCLRFVNAGYLEYHNVLYSVHFCIISNLSPSVFRTREGGVQKSRAWASIECGMV